MHVVRVHAGGRQRPPEQWDRHAATILQGQSVGGRPSSRRATRTTRASAPLKKDNRLLIYGLGSLAPVSSSLSFPLSAFPLLFSLPHLISSYLSLPLSLPLSRFTVVSSRFVVLLSVFTRPGYLRGYLDTRSSKIPGVSLVYIVSLRPQASRGRCTPIVEFLGEFSDA